MKKTILILALLGTAVSSYLVYEHYGAPIVCIGTGCEIVDASRYSETLGVPNALMGIISYLMILALAVGALRSSSERFNFSTLGIYGISLIGTGYSIYLTIVSATVIRAFCNWCLTSAVIITLIFVLTVIQIARSERELESVDRGVQAT